MSKKNSTHIRVNIKDRDIWREYCSLTGEKSPDLFGKILTSDELKLRERIKVEAKKRLRRLG